MKSLNMKILYFDFLYEIIGDMHRDRKEILTSAFQSKISGEFPAIDDLSKLEMYEIMRQPVICPVKMTTLKKPVMQLRILCCSYSMERLFLYLFSGDEWQFYYANF